MSEFLEYGGTFIVDRTVWDDPTMRSSLTYYITQTTKAHAERNGYDTNDTEWRVEPDPEDELFRRPVLAVGVVGRVSMPLTKGDLPAQEGKLSW